MTDDIGNFDYTYSLECTVSTTIFWKGNNGHTIDKNKFFINGNKKTSNIEIYFVDKRKDYIWNVLHTPKSYGYVIEKFICKNESNENVLVDLTELKNDDIRYSREYLNKTLPDNISYCKVYFKPMYDILYRHLSYFNYELYYHCLDQTELDIIKNQPIFNQDNKKILLFQSSSKYSIKLDDKSAYKLDFFENVKTGEIFTFDSVQTNVQ